MKFINQIEEVIGSRSKVQILRLLASGQPLTGRQIAIRLKMSVWSCHRSLRELVNNALLDFTNAGRNYLYRINRDCYLMREMILPLFQKEREALSLFLEKAFRDLDPSPLSVTLFGSVARRDELPHSGVDLCVIVSTQKEKEAAQKRLAERRILLLLEFGNLLSPYILTQEELAEKMKNPSPVLQKIIAEGKLILGKTLIDATRS